MPISKEQALAIAQEFMDATYELGKYRFQHFQNLSPAQVQSVEDAEWELLNYSSSFITKAVGIALADLQADLQTIADAIAAAKQVIKTIDALRDVIDVVAALIQLGGAIATGEPDVIVKKAKDLLGVAQAILKKPAPTDG